jgi:hypothetical protein
MHQRIVPMDAGLRRNELVDERIAGSLRAKTESSGDTILN